MAARTIHTERLDLAPWQPEHADALAHLARVSGVVPSIARDPRWDPEHPEVLSRALLHHWEAHGFGWRAIAERSAGGVSGFVGVTYLGENALGLDPSDLEFGCWVHPAHWRRGIAAEASIAVIDQAFDEFGAESVVGCAREDHRASIAGATAIGFHIDQHTETTGGAGVVVLRVSAAEWEAARGAASRS